MEPPLVITGTGREPAHARVVPVPVCYSHAIGNRARELGLEFGEQELKDITKRIKAMADAGPLSMDTLDGLLREWVVA